MCQVYVSTYTLDALLPPLVAWQGFDKAFEGNHLAKAGAARVAQFH